MYAMYNEEEVMKDYCPECGQFVGADAICPNCGAELFDESGLNEEENLEDEDA